MFGSAFDTATASIPRTLAVCLAAMVPALLLGTRLFGLTWFGAGALYFVVWWTLLFVVLPFRARDDGSQPIVPGQDLGAPPLPQMRRKVLWTTLLSDLVFVVAVAAFPLAGL